MIKFENINKYILFFLIFLTSSFAVCNDIISSQLVIFFWIVVMILLLMQLKEINKKLLITFFLMLICIWMSAIINKDNIMALIKTSFSIVSVFIYANIINFEKFKKDYIDIIKFICIISLCGFTFFSIFKSMKSFFIQQNLSNNSYACLYLYVHPINYLRNCGLFWEPGAFQTFIGLAILFEIMNTNPSKKNILLFIITMITTFSTTGYFALIFLILLSLHRKNVDYSIKIYIVIAVVITIVFIFSNQTLFFNRSRSTAFGKVLNFIEKDSRAISNKRQTSTSIRVNSIIYPFIEYTKRPIFGCGYTGLNINTYMYTRNMNTCTFINWFAVYGTLYGIIMLTGFIKFSKKLAIRKVEFFTIILILMILIVSENYVNNAFIILLALYGYKNSNIIIKEQGYESIMDS